MTKTARVLLLVTFLFCLLGPVSALAQTPAGAIVIYPAVEHQDDSLALDIFFTVYDQNGRPLPHNDTNIESASIELLGGGSAPVPASVGDPKTPIYITLLLDGSGSMANVMGNVREAAKEAIENATPNASFAVVKFNELAVDQDLRPIENFTNDHVLIQGAIDAVESDPGAPTCMYNATYKAIELLDKQIKSPQERRAIILFTDGKDERADGTRCSQRDYNDVIYRATRGGSPITPIHTIGLCSDDGCSNINRTELAGMAKDTFGFSAVGTQNNLNTLFREIIDGLNSQWVAHANVFANEGQNQAVLTVKLRDFDTPLTTTFNFFSKRDYDVPPPPANAEITSLIYNEDTDVYALGLSVASPDLINQVIVEVWDEKNGTQVPPEQIFENPEATLQFERNSQGLVPGREYSFRVKAVDKKGFLVAFGEKQETLLDLKTFVYEPPEREAVAFNIKSVQADFKTPQLNLNLDVLDKKQDINTYEGFIVDVETGAGIYDFTPTLFPTGGRIQEQLPPAIRQLQGPREYRVTLFLTTKDGRRLATDPYEFKAVPPPPPGLIARIQQTLTANPIVIVSVLVVTLSASILVIFMKRPGRRASVPTPLPRPPVDHTMIGLAAVEPDPVPQAARVPNAAPQAARVPESAKETKLTPIRARLKVLQTSNPIPEKEKVITSYPFVVGREGCHFNFPDDRRISRRHLEITVRGQQIYVTDLGSQNGTFIDESRLQPKTPTPLNGATKLRLGRKTCVELIVG
ncbi:MAG: FHA domain-containing protein [Anaerolineae bacterium]|nr:FHA domain-containing protein [Anaerolineae bacterium]